MAVYELTREGYEKLKDKLNYLKGEKYKDLSDKVDKGRKFCDFNEDPVFQSSVDEFMALKKEIIELENIIGQAEIVEDQNTEQIGIGSLVTVKDILNDEDIQFKIVSSIEVETCEHCISEQSPVGKHLMGHRLNDQVKISTPSGEMVYLIKQIE